MAKPYFKGPLIVPGASIYTLDPTKEQTLLNLGYEPELDAHWVFGSTSATLVDKVGASSLVRGLYGAVSGGTGYPVSSETALVFAGGTGTGAAGYAVINSSGVPTGECFMTNHGSYTVAPTATISTAGGGSGATVTITLGAAPSFASGWLTTTTGRNGLASTFSDAAENTVLAIVKNPGTANQLIFDNGADGALNGGAGTGAALIKLGSNPHRAYSGGMSLQVTTSPGATGNWEFVAMSHKPVDGRTVTWGGGTAYVQAGTKSLRTTPPKLGLGLIGNAFTNSYNVSLDVLEYGIANRKLTANEIIAYYTRAKARQLALGRTVL